MRATTQVSKAQAEEKPSLSALHHSGWWARLDSNQEPTDYESAALTVELRAPRFPYLTHSPRRYGAAHSLRLRPGVGPARESAGIPVRLVTTVTRHPWQRRRMIALGTPTGMKK